MLLLLFLAYSISPVYAAIYIEIYPNTHIKTTPYSDEKDYNARTYLKVMEARYKTEKPVIVTQEYKGDYKVNIEELNKWFLYYINIFRQENGLNAIFVDVTENSIEYAKFRTNELNYNLSTKKTNFYPHHTENEISHNRKIRVGENLLFTQDNPNKLTNSNVFSDRELAYFLVRNYIEEYFNYEDNYGHTETLLFNPYETTEFGVYYDQYTDSSVMIWLDEDYPYEDDVVKTETVSENDTDYFLIEGKKAYTLPKEEFYYKTTEEIAEKIMDKHTIPKNPNEILNRTDGLVTTLYVDDEDNTLDVLTGVSYAEPKEIKGYVLVKVDRSETNVTKYIYTKGYLETNDIELNNKISNFKNKFKHYFQELSSKDVNPTKIISILSFLVGLFMLRTIKKITNVRKQEEDLE